MSNIFCVLFVTLSACAPSPHFTHPPAAASAVAGPRTLAGSWARAGRDNGERALVSADGDDGVKVLLFAAGGAPADIPTASLRLTRFADGDWAVVDMRTLGGSSYAAAPYVLIRYEYNGDDRLCARPMATQPLLDAVRAGQLEGIVGGESRRETVLITAPTHTWLVWLETQPDRAQLLGGAEGCFIRVER